ncbi:MULTISPECIES: hypothetical protein [Nonomuraea]|uniref:hypothetical protein n=1 Tax=Nonomuraea TaxID=83681 RepID=UPI001C5E3383|nr:hypothetical protein [Nonomuraea ceibae]
MFTRTAAKLLTIAVALAGAGTVALAAAPAAGAEAANPAGSHWDHCDLWSRYGGLHCYTGYNSYTGHYPGDRGGRGLLGGLLGL